MNLPQLSADLAARVPEMAKDSATNNAELIQGILSDAELIARRECPKCVELKAEVERLRQAIEALLKGNGGPTRSEAAEFYGRDDDLVLVQMQDFRNLEQVMTIAGEP